MSSGQPAGSYEGMTTEELFDQYHGTFDLNCMNFPADWTEHVFI